MAHQGVACDESVTPQVLRGGTYAAFGSLSRFSGRSSFGEWRLKLTDSRKEDQGYFSQLRLKLYTTVFGAFGPLYVPYTLPCISL
eukprot:90640-Prorocentrum_minimum.AAC.1